MCICVWTELSNARVSKSTLKVSKNDMVKLYSTSMNSKVSFFNLDSGTSSRIRYHSKLRREFRISGGRKSTISEFACAVSSAPRVRRARSSMSRNRRNFRSNLARWTRQNSRWVQGARPRFVLTQPIIEHAAAELWRARSRLYRSQILQRSMRWEALAEIYTMHSFALF